MAGCSKLFFLVSCGLSHTDTPVSLLGDRSSTDQPTNESLGHDCSHPAGLLPTPGLSWGPQHLDLLASDRTVDTSHTYLPDWFLYEKCCKIEIWILKAGSYLEGENILSKLALMAFQCPHTNQRMLSSTQNKKPDGVIHWVYKYLLKNYLLYVKDSSRRCVPKINRWSFCFMELTSKQINGQVNFHFLGMQIAMKQQRLWIGW